MQEDKRLNVAHSALGVDADAASSSSSENPSFASLCLDNVSYSQFIFEMFHLNRSTLIEI